MTLLQENGFISPEDNKNYYPSLLDLSFLKLPPYQPAVNASSLQSNNSSKPKLSNPSDPIQPTPVPSSSEVLTSEKSIIIDETQNNSTIKTAPTPSRLPSQSSSWYYVRPVFIDHHTELQQHAYKALSPYIVKKKFPIQCNILVFDHDDEEIIYFHRLTKVLSKNLFSTRLEILSSSMKIDFHSLSPLCLSPLSFVKKYLPQPSFHQLTLHQHISWLPMYSSFQYDNDPQLRKQLWSILKQQPFAYTRKS